MSDEAFGGEETVTYTYDMNGPIHHFEHDAEAAEVYTYPVKATSPVHFEHDPKARVFRLTVGDGPVEVFRDNPTRYLCVEPDESGAMRPVLKHGRPVYLYLAREEREVR